MILFYTKNVLSHRFCFAVVFQPNMWSCLGFSLLFWFCLGLVWLVVALLLVLLPLPFSISQPSLFLQPTRLVGCFTFYVTLSFGLGSVCSPNNTPLSLRKIQYSLINVKNLKKKKEKKRLTHTYGKDMYVQCKRIFLLARKSLYFHSFHLSAVRCSSFSSGKRITSLKTIFDKSRSE